MNDLGFASVPAIKQYLRYAEDQNLDVAKALNEANISPSVLEKDNGRISGLQFQALIKSLIEQSDDLLLGLHSGAYVQPGSYSVLGYITMSCATLAEAIERIAPYEKLVGDMGVTRIERLDGEILVRWQCAYIEPIVRHHMIDNVLLSWCNFARWLANMKEGPLEVRLEHDLPDPALLPEYEAAFGCPVRFNQPYSAVAINEEYMQTSLRQPDQNLRRTLESHASQQMSEIQDEGRSLSADVRQAIYEQLRSGISRKDMVAEQLGMTARTLQRKLQLENASYQQLLDEVRQQLAEEYLRLRHLSIADIAANLGFTESRSFHRSFKNWTGMTPGEYREQVHGE